MNYFSNYSASSHKQIITTSNLKVQNHLIQCKEKYAHKKKKKKKEKRNTAIKSLSWPRKQMWLLWYELCIYTDFRLSAASVVGHIKMQPGAGPRSLSKFINKQKSHKSSIQTSPHPKDICSISHVLSHHTFLQVSAVVHHAVFNLCSGPLLLVLAKQRCPMMSKTQSAQDTIANDEKI